MAGKFESAPSKDNKMGVMPEGKLIANMAIPLIISMLVQALYNVVDSIYVSRISNTGSAVTALSLAFPIQNLLIGFSTGVAVGVNALLSRSLGEKNQERANRTAGNGFILSAVGCALFMIFGLFGARPYFEMQSTVAETIEGGAVYTMIVTVFSQGLFCSILGERLLQSSGRTVYSMISQATGAIINIVLDPIMIFNFNMGMAGAAVATVIGQFCATGVSLFFNLKYNKDIVMHIRYLKPDLSVIKPILTVGVPSMIMMVISSFMNFGMNQIMQGFTETATGVFGIYYKLQSFFFMPMFGMNNANISIIAYNYGAKKPSRITKTIKIGCGIAFCVMMVGLLAFQFIPDLLLSAFNPTPEFLEIGRNALRIISVHFPVAGFCIVLTATFQALGNGIYSTIVSLCRQLVVLLPSAYLLSLSGNVNMIWWAFPIAEVMSLAVTIFFFIRIYNQKVKPLKA